MIGCFNRFFKKANITDELKIRNNKRGFFIAGALSVVSSLVMLEDGVLGDNSIIFIVFGVLSFVFAAIAIAFAMSANELLREITQSKLNSAVHNRKDPIIEDVA